MAHGPPLDGHGTREFVQPTTAEDAPLDGALLLWDVPVREVYLPDGQLAKAVREAGFDERAEDLIKRWNVWHLSVATFLELLEKAGQKQKTGPPRGGPLISKY